VQRAGQLATAPGGAAGRAEPGGNLRFQRQRHRRTRDSGQLECPSPTEPEDAGTGATRGLHRQAQLEKRSCGATRGSRNRGAEGCEIRGNSNLHRRQGRKMRKPRRLGAHREARRVDRSRGATWSFTAGSVEGCEIQGNLKIHRRQSLKMPGCGATRSHIGRRNWKREAEGRPEVPAPVALKDAKFGATRRSIAGTALEMQDSGQPEDLAQG